MDPQNTNGQNNNIDQNIQYQPIVNPNQVINDQSTSPLVNIQPPIQNTMQASQPVQQNNPIITKTTDPGKTLGVIGLILAFIFPLAGFVFSGLARQQSKKAGIKNKLASIGLVISSIMTVLVILFAVLSTFAIINLSPSNYIVGEWRVANSDYDNNQVMTFSRDGDYFWYKDGSDRNDNYFYGKYTYELGNETNDEGQLTTAGGRLLYTLTLDQNGVKKNNGTGDRSGESLKVQFLGEINEAHDQIVMASMNGNYELVKIE